MGFFNKTPEEKFDKASYKSSGRAMLKLAEEGMQKAMTNMAFRYMRGFGVREDLNKAMKWADSAADENKFGLTQDTVEAYYTKGNVYDCFKNEDKKKIAAESYKKAYLMGENFERCNYSEFAGVALARLYMELKVNLDEVEEVLTDLKNKKDSDAKFELGRYYYRFENNLVTAIRYFSELLKEKYGDPDAVIFEMEDIISDTIKKISKIKPEEISLKDIEETKALKEFITEHDWEDEYLATELDKFLSKHQN